VIASKGLLLVAVAAASLGCLGTEESRAEAPRAAPELGAGRAPDFELRSLDGNNVRLSEHFGKDVVLLDFWATWCQPCLVALPHLDELYQKYRSQGFVVLAVSIDEAALGSRVRVEAAKLKLSFPVLLDPETEVVARYNPRSTAPYSVLVGRDGRILSRREGFTVSERQILEEEVRRALGL
jgi:cytochrome c biogenesis protein CcmG/thiol:disulfide interchange protein DsbE